MDDDVTTTTLPLATIAITKRASTRKHLWRAWKLSPRPRPKTKELKECFAFVDRTERILKRRTLIIDIAGGHGALGMAFKVHRNMVRSKKTTELKVIIGDLHGPGSYHNLKRAWLPEEEEQGLTNVHHKMIDIRDRGWLLQILKSENIKPTDCGVVGCHVCNALSDEVIDECLKAHVEFCIMGCCHGSTSQQGILIKTSAKELGVSLGMLVDTARFGVIANSKGYMAKIRTIDANITPENRILIGVYDDQNEEEKALHTANALKKVETVYERVFRTQEET